MIKFKDGNSIKPLKKIGRESDFIMLDQPFMGLLGVWLDSALNKKVLNTLVLKNYKDWSTYYTQYEVIHRRSDIKL